MKSLKNVTIISKRRKNLYGKSFFISRYTDNSTIYTIKSNSSDSVCRVEWDFMGATPAYIDYNWYEVIDNIKGGNWVLL